MEQPNIRMHKHHPPLIRRLHTLFIHHTPPRRRKVPNPTLPSPMHIIREREKRIARTRNPIQLPHPLPLLLFTQPHQLLSLIFLKQTLPMLLLTPLQLLSGHIQINSIRLLSTLNPLFKW